MNATARPAATQQTVGSAARQPCPRGRQRMATWYAAHGGVSEVVKGRVRMRSDGYKLPDAFRARGELFNAPNRSLKRKNSAASARPIKAAAAEKRRAHRQNINDGCGPASRARQTTGATEGDAETKGGAVDPRVGQQRGDRASAPQRRADAAGERECSALAKRAAFNSLRASLFGWPACRQLVAMR